MFTERQQQLIEIEGFWCQRMTQLTEENRYEDADALYTEFIVGQEDPITLFGEEHKWDFLQSVYSK